MVFTVLALALIARLIKRWQYRGKGTDEKQHVGEDVIAIIRNA